MLYNSLTVILFSVKVPVLSEHNTVAEPRASMALGLRASTLCLDMRQAPKAMKTVMITGNSSGMTAMAKVNPANTPLSNCPLVST
ncbi:MAG: hypothetical protein BWY72_02127 [Bacteroidetes bacterium ADurb.Bin416]|nr:MAG: hypothetical protein BWY72_02127 [Bacteroidetes bacterium ADurb.Bin416]